MTSDEAQRIALFRYQVIAPLLSLSGPRGSLKRELERLASRTHEHPTRGAIRVGAGTMREWLTSYRRHGLDGLTPATRRDTGQSRAIDDRIAEFVEDLASSRPDLDGPGILEELHCHFSKDGVRLPSLSSLYRFLRAKGLDGRRGPPRRDHRAYQFDLAGDCWQGDVMYGPALTDPSGKRRRTYLIAILDDATRVIAHAQFYFEQHLRSLKDALKQAFQKRGLPRRLYFDNGKVFRSRTLLRISARLGIQLIHSQPYRPQGRAKIERWFRRIRQSFLPRVDTTRLESIDELNRLLWAWVEGLYHLRPHRGIEGECPLDRWVRLSGGLRTLPETVDLEELFLDETTRRVAKDGTIRLQGSAFEVGPSLIAERVTVRFDPFDLRRVLVSTKGREPIEAFPVDLAGNRRVKRQSPSPETAVDPRPLESLEEIARSLEEETPTDNCSQEDEHEHQDE